MKNLLTYKDFLNEAVSGKGNSTITKRIKINFEIDNEFIGKVEDEIVLAMSPDSTGVFTIGKDVEKYCGIPEKDVIRDVKAGKESPDDAIIYGLCNIMNGGSDIYFWTNGTRLAGTAKKNGLWPALLEQISHEAGVHLTRSILTRAIAKKKGVSIDNTEWITFDYGSGEYFWPAVGENGDKKNPLVMIDEESFATASGLVVQTITDEFLKMASNYIPELKMIIKE
jgi:hypothetical protein